MSKRQVGGYLGGGTVIRASASLALPREKTKKHEGKVRLERQKLEAAREAFKKNIRGVGKRSPLFSHTEYVRC